MNSDQQEQAYATCAMTSSLFLRILADLDGSGLRSQTLVPPQGLEDRIRSTKSLLVHAGAHGRAKIVPNSTELHSSVN